MTTQHTFSILFWLNKSKANDGQAPIWARITVDGKRKEVSVKRKLDMKLWNSQKGRANSTRQEAREINLYLDQVQSQLHSIYQEMKAANELVTAEAIKNRFTGAEQKEHSLVKLFEYHNEEMKESLAWGTLKNYFTTQKYVVRFLKQERKTSDIYLSQLNYAFVTGFERFVKTYKPATHRQPCTQNGAMKHIERLRKVVNLAVKNGWLKDDPFKQFKLKFEKKDRGFLTAEELQRIEEKDLIDRLDQTRDIFVFSCYTGLSYAEVFDLRPEHIVIGLDGNRWIRAQRKKSGEWFKVPLLPKALAIIEKYQDDPLAQANGKVLPVYTNQKTNAYLKEIANLCEVKKRLTYHLARHTFATTVTLANGVPIESVSKMLGHTNLRTTQIYAKVVEQKLSEDMGALEQRLSKTTSKQNKQISF
ncbi:MAG: site-specific integrase [Bacteroidota bacterium]